MLNKKAQGISINVIIIAAIALAVLVVLFAIFTGRLNLFAKGTQATEEKAYRCVCVAPIKNNVCAATQPSGSTEVPVPQECGRSWTDCPLNCYELQTT